MDIGTPWAEILAILLAYAIGGVPFGWLLARFAKRVDLRIIGSGNIGATNASRLWEGGASIVAFGTVFVLDCAKGFAAAALSPRLGTWLHAASTAETVGALCGAGAILGHMFTPYLKFVGGKGVATTLGVVTALAPWSSLISVVIWAVLVLATRYMSLGSIGAMIALPISFFILHGDETFTKSVGIFLFLVALAPMIVWRHRANIHRILNGSERRVGAQDQQL